MNYRDPQTRIALSAEYVLGTLHGRARARFERLLQTDDRLRREVQRWQNDLYPTLIDALPEQAPPDRLWQAISSTTRRVIPFAGRPPLAGPQEAPDLAIWRRSSRRDSWHQLATAAVLLLAIYLVLDVAYFQPPPAAPVLQVTVNDESALPAWSITLERDRRLLNVSTIRTQTITPANSFELWMLPGDNQAPVSLGLIPASGEISLRLTPDLAAALVQAGGVAVSLEPAGGSPTGQPTGPILYQGAIEPAA